MTLFNMDDLKSEDFFKKQPKSKAVKIDNLKNEIKLSTAEHSVGEIVGKIEMGKTIHYVSISEWSMHDLLFHILKQTGPAEVFFATWSISEDALRKIIEKCETGEIYKVSAMFDWRIKVRRPKALQLANFNIADIRLTTCHAKTTVIKNKNWNIAIVGSANYTNNPRIESGVICCDNKIADFHYNWMKEESSGADPFDTKKKNKRGK